MKNKVLCLVALALLSISPLTLFAAEACKTDKVNPDLHSLYIDRLGRLTSVEEKIIPAAAEAAYVNAIADSIKENRHLNPDLKLVLFIHGGLNTFEASSKRPQEFSRDMLCDGYYPVFISWNSGFPTTYVDHLFRIRRGENAPLVATLTSPFVFIEDVGRSIVRIPAAVYKEIEGPVKVALWSDTKEERFAEERFALLKGTKINIVSNGPFRGVGSSYWDVINPLKFLTAPMADGFGTGSWNAMLRRTDLVLSKTTVFEGDINPKTFEAGEADTAVATFLRQMVSDPELAQTNSLLIGHSMGTIIANDILTRHPDVNFSRVVYMGAAASVKDVEAAVVPWMQQAAHKDSQFYNLSLDPYREISESHAFDSVPRGSLLNWIDYIYGDVNSFKDRTAGSWWNMLRMAQDVFPEDLYSRIHLTRFPIGKADMGPQMHGDFGDYCFWQESLWEARTPLKRHSKNSPVCR